MLAFLTALLGDHTANERRAIFNALRGVKAAGFASDAVGDNAGVFINKNARGGVSKFE